MILTPDEVATLLKLDIKTVRASLNRGEMKGMKIGHQWRIPAKQFDDLFDLDEIQAIIRANAAAAAVKT